MMPGEPLYLPSDQVLQRLSKLFITPAHDRSVYVVFGPYERLQPFQKRLETEVARGGFHNELGKVEYMSLTAELFNRLEESGCYESAASLARHGRIS
jgi:hypothetical protein